MSECCGHACKCDEMLYKTCEICRDKFNSNDGHTICPECLRRLERMLYPERED